MYFKRVEVTGFRNLTSTSFSPSPFRNLISGDNGSGKSSLLEAIHYLATGSSFRTHKVSTIINKGEECFTLYSEISHAITHRIGLKRCRDLKHTTRIDGRDIHRRSELVQILPLQVISPESISLLLDGAEQRRNFIDWSLFHVEQSFYYHLSHYQRALKQRNSLLKSGTAIATELPHWDSQLVQHGLVIDQMRRHYVEQLSVLTMDILNELLPEQELILRYRRGWPSNLALDAALQRSLESDIKMKYTTSGPHRGDLLVMSDQGKAAETLSRGQLKLTVVALKLAQVLLLQHQSGRIPVILIDDLAAELDLDHRSLLLDKLSCIRSQIFITTPERKLIDCCNWDEKKVFHVEHGVIKEVV